MGIFTLKRMYWDDNGDYTPCWSLSDEEQQIEASAAEVQAYVDQLNNRNIEEAVKDLEETLAREMKNLQTSKARLEAAESLSEEIRNNLGIDFEKLNRDVKRNEKSIEETKQGLEEVKKDPYGPAYGMSYRCHMRERFFFEPIEFFQIVQNSSGNLELKPT